MPGLAALNHYQMIEAKIKEIQDIIKNHALDYKKEKVILNLLGRNQVFTNYSRK